MSLIKARPSSGLVRSSKECPDVLERPFPSLQNRKEGVAERSKKCRAASSDRREAQARQRAASREAGVVFRRIRKENHPGCVGFGGFAKFLMTQPPLLAVMQGGEYNA